MGAGNQEEIENTSTPVKKKYVPHKILRDATVYLSVADSNYVIAFKPVIAKVSRILGEDGKPAFDKDGNPSYWLEWNHVVTMLTNDEWKIHKEQGE